MGIINNFYYWINEGRGFPTLKQTNPAHAYHLIIAGGFLLFLVIKKILDSKGKQIEKKILAYKHRMYDKSCTNGRGEDDENQ